MVQTDPRWVRLPSEDTEYSDWQIDIQLRGCSEITSYLVHRYKLGTQSTYFKALFSSNDRFIESNTKRCSIEIPEELPFRIGREEFELFLNYFYRFPNKENYYRFERQHQEWYRWRHEDLMPMLYLSDYFGVEALSKAMFEFFHHSCHYCTLKVHLIEWVSKAYQFAETFPIGNLQAEIERVCFQNSKCDLNAILNLLPTPVLRQQFFDGVFTNRPVCFFRGRGLGKRVFLVLQEFPELVTREFFKEFLIYLCRPRGDRYLLLRREHIFAFLKHEQRLSLDDPETDNLTPFQKECVKELVFIPHERIDREKAFYLDRKDKITPEEILATLRTLKPAIGKAVSVDLLGAVYRCRRW